jgi:hypothetical protein
MEGAVDSTRVNFLREMSDRHRSLFVWKHLERALRGQGDVDAAAPAGDLANILADIDAIGQKTLGATHVIRCHHVADKSLHFFVQPDRLPQLFELDICTQPSRGLAPWATPSRMLAMTVVTPEGIRRLRPGAEAVVSIVYHGLSSSGRARLQGDDLLLVNKGLAEDMVGVEQACLWLPPRPARRSLFALAAQLSQGRWERRTAQHTYIAFAAAALAHPAFTARRALFRFQLAAGRECVMSRLARLDNRRVPASGLDRMLGDARADGHLVVEF